MATTVVSSKEGYDAMTDWQTQSCKTLKGINQPITGALSQPITGALSDPFPDTGTSSPECGTGILTVTFARHGRTVDGVGPSASMLA